MVSRELSDDLASDVEEIFTDANDFGQVVTHKPRQSASVSINGVFTPSVGTVWSADRHNRQQVIEGQLLVGLNDTAGVPYTLDNDGTFTVDGVTYLIATALPTPGGYVVKLTRENRKTLNSARNS